MAPRCRPPLAAGKHRPTRALDARNKHWHETHVHQRASRLRAVRKRLSDACLAFAAYRGRWNGTVVMTMPS